MTAMSMTKDRTPNGQTIVRGKRTKRLLSEAIQLEEEIIPEFIHSALLGISALVILFIVWAALVEVSEVAIAQGEVVPSALVKVVQHLEGGVVSEILVKEGTMVEDGQVLARFSGAQSKAELKQMQVRYAALRLRAERLAAFNEGRPLDFEGIGDEYPELVADQEKILRDQLGALATGSSVIKSQIEQRKREIRQLRESLTIALQHQELTGNMLKMRERLVEKKLITKMVYLETKRAKVTADGEVARINDEISVASQSLVESNGNLANLEAQLRREASVELGGVSAEIAEVRNSLSRLEDRVQRLEVRAPVRGLVQDLRVGTVGEVVQPGAIMMKVVPLDGNMEAEVRISPRDIGYVRIGHPVLVKVGSYDYSRFGGVEGELIRLSPSSTCSSLSSTVCMDPVHDAYFKGWVSISRPYVGKDPEKLHITPGMSIEADITTGQKTMLHYLMKPVADAVSNAFRER
ncbi:MAG: hypothetical protein A3G18_08830 [Rhodospirillales bacterium RIFCSPLOWO2_12_FULL_58_28]|nr:MAG: hypothetical protein A3H92_10870 [Rhodospirillales bacterium RIFCSPLOWO2_02_FULL_58_16]OHC79585.1 MAG: hypothetical protein A3G18_08830 [Rhodospirillales bacterium RIFCSPLOWO2_12_FULL_58_28]